MQFNLSSQTSVLCYLMSCSIVWYESKSWFFQPSLLGQHAIATEHYGIALQDVAYYLIQLPTHILLQIFHGSSSAKEFLEIHVMYLIRQVLKKFLKLSPSTTDLYFLVALAEPVIQSLDTDYDTWGYLWKVSVHVFHIFDNFVLDKRNSMIEIYIINVIY